MNLLLAPALHGLLSAVAGGAPGCILTFHRVAEPAAWQRKANRGFHLDTAFLDALLGYLVATGWSVVTCEEMTARLPDRVGDRRMVNFSIDDCYRDTYEILVPLFRRHGLPVSIYVTTGIPDGTLALWQAGLEEILSERPEVLIDGSTVVLADDGTRRQVFARTSAAWDGPHAAHRFRRFCIENGVEERILHQRHAISWDMLDDLKSDPLVEIGAHTVTHARVAELGENAAAAEMGGSAARLRERLGLPVRHFAFPFGRRGDCGPRDFDRARRLGFATAATTSKGLVRRGQDPYSLPRNTLNGEHRMLLAAEAHLTGGSGVAARILQRV